jgi:uncharacterized membrane protein YqaE (UPF0057 family)
MLRPYPIPTEMNIPSGICVPGTLPRSVIEYTLSYPRGMCMDCLRVVLSVIIPPLGVFFKVGFGLHFWLNIVLTLLGYIPGLVHAIWVIATH